MHVFSKYKNKRFGYAIIIGENKLLHLRKLENDPPGKKKTKNKIKQTKNIHYK